MNIEPSNANRNSLSGNEKESSLIQMATIVVDKFP